MHPYLELGNHSYSMRDVMINFGSCITVIVLGVLLYQRYVKREKGWKNAVRYIVIPIGIEVINVFTLGNLLGTLIRALTYPLSGDMGQDVKQLENAGTHFIGTVIATAIVLPVLFRLLYGSEKKNGLLNCCAFFLTIQHIFNRLGCFLEGCCYGICSNGILSIKFPDEIASYRVFPSQLFEVFCMLVLLTIQIWLYKKGRDIFRITLAGFGISIFISEFFMDQKGIVTYMNLTAIQLFSLLLAGGVVVSVLIQQKRRR